MDQPRSIRANMMLLSRKARKPGQSTRPGAGSIPQRRPASPWRGTASTHWSPPAARRFTPGGMISQTERWSLTTGVKAFSAHSRESGNPVLCQELGPRFRGDERTDDSVLLDQTLDESRDRQSRADRL